MTVEFCVAPISVNNLHVARSCSAEGLPEITSAASRSRCSAWYSPSA